MHSFVKNTEMLVVEELYKEAVVNTSRALIVFNGELDRIRSGCILKGVCISNLWWTCFNIWMLSFSLRILKITHHFSTQSLVNFARLFCQRWRLFITSTTSKDATVESFSGKASAVFLVLVTLNRTRLTVLSVYVYRCYPGPWRVLRKVRSSYICLHEQESMPSLKEVALDILPSA